MTEHPVLRVGVETAAVDYELAEDPATRPVAVAQGEDGQPVNRFLVAPTSEQDLLLRRELVELGSRRCFGFPPFAKEGGTDGLNAIAVAAAHADVRHGTSYRRRVEAYRRYLQERDLSLSVAMTDVKGDRGARPGQQQDPDLYLRVVDRRSDGIVVRGAKAHITAAPYSNELLVLPTRALQASESDYAVAFAIPIDTPGVIIVTRPTGAGGADVFDRPVSSRADIIEGLVIFDDVFVPYERVFLNGEWDIAGVAVEMFANYHRVTAAAYKYPFAELLAGVAYLLADANGALGIAHVRDKLAWLVMYAETIAALSRGACLRPRRDGPSGLVYPDPVLGNAAKFFFADNYHQAVKAVQDIAGGILVTAPSGQDYACPELRPYLDKYLAARPGFPAGDRLRLIKLAQDLVASELGGFWEVTSIHAEGSLSAERLAAFRSADWPRYTGAALRAVGLAGGEATSEVHAGR